MLIKIKKLDFTGHYAYAPPQVDALVNTDRIISVTVADARGSGPFVQLTIDGEDRPWTCVGRIEDFLPKQQQGPIITLSQAGDCEFSEKDIERMTQEFQEHCPQGKLIVTPASSSIQHIVLPDGCVYHRELVVSDGMEREVEIIARSEQEIRDRLKWITRAISVE